MVGSLTHTKHISVFPDVEEALVIDIVQHLKLFSRFL